MNESTRAITDVILKKAKNEAESIIQEAEKVVEDKLEEQRRLGVQRAREEGSTLLKKAKNEAELNKLNIIQNAKIKAKMTVLSKKEQIITSVLHRTKNELRALTQTKEYIPILEKLIIEAGTILRDQELEILLNERDSTWPLNLDRVAKEIGKKTGGETKLRISEEHPQVIGGAVVRTFDGKVVMDNTFEDILNRRERKLRLKIARILFSKGDETR